VPRRYLRSPMKISKTPETTAQPLHTGGTVKNRFDSKITL